MASIFAPSTVAVKLKTWDLLLKEHALNATFNGGDSDGDGDGDGGLVGVFLLLWSAIYWSKVKEDGINNGKS